jgi:S-adenosylmethionine decarboxylase
VLLAESHLAVHTWPEIDAVTIDAYVCNLGADNTPRAHALMARLLDAFAPREVRRQALSRGAVVAEPRSSAAV